MAFSLPPRFAKKHCRMMHDFALSGLIEYGCSI